MKLLVGVLLAISFFSVNANAVTSPSIDKDGQFTVSWILPLGHEDPVVREYKNGVFLGTTSVGPVGPTQTSVTVSGRSDGIWKYSIAAHSTIGDGGLPQPLPEPGQPDSSSTGIVTLGTTTTEVLLSPGVPGGFTAPTSVQEGSYQISWSNASGSVDRYELQEKKNNGGWARVSNSSSKSVNISGRDNGIYQYRARACNDSAFSSAISCGSWTGIKTVTVIFRPSSIATPASDNNGVYSISWQSVSGVEEYELREKLNNDSYKTIYTGSATEITLSGKVTGKYQYAVRAKLAGKYSAWRYSGGFYVSVRPGSITFPSGVDTDGSFSISWDNVSGANNYILEQQKNGGSWVSLDTGSDNSHTVSGLQTATYAYRVATVIEGIHSEYRNSGSKVVILTPESITVPSEDNDGKFAVEWAAVAAASDYELQQQVNGGSWSTLANLQETSRELTLSTSGSYKYRVRAKLGGSVGAWRTSASAVVSIIPASITITEVDKSAGKLKISWGEVPGADEYILEQSKGNGAWVETCRIVGTACDLSGLLTGEYSYRVAGIKGGLLSGFRTSTVVVIRGVEQLLVPSEVSGNSFSIDWSAVDGADSYELEERFESGSWATIYKGSNLTQFISVSLGGTYQYRVRATLANSQGAWTTSNGVEVIGSTNPSDPEWAQGLVEGITPLDSAYIEASPKTHNAGVGTMEGSGSVSGGAASYNIPIQLPPGRNEIQPSVSVNFSSRAGNNLLGVGWSINATSKISRCPESLAIDGVKGVVNYDSDSDKLCLDGERLIAVSGVYGQSGATYRSLIDTFARITQTGDINGASTYFKVEYKNGRIAYYGSTSDSRHSHGGKSQIYSWALAKVEDRTIISNSIHYEYSNFSHGEHLLTDIYYSGEGDSQGDRRVHFEYEARPDISSMYLAGGLTRSTQRLISIDTRISSSVIRSYHFSYHLSDASARSLLNKIEECNSSGECFPASTLGWNENSPTFTLEKVGYLNSSGSLSPQLQHLNRVLSLNSRGDVDGDGVVDWPLWRHDAEGVFRSSEEYAGDFCSSNPLTHRMYCLISDFDRDGKTDMWQINSGKLQISYENSNGNRSWLSTDISFDLTDVELIRSFGDFNGDNWPDVIVERGSLDGSGYLQLYLHSGEVSRPFSTAPVRVYDFETFNAGAPIGEFRTSEVQFIGDVDGNGSEDFIEVDLYIDAESQLATDQPTPKIVFLAKPSSVGSLAFEQKALLSNGGDAPFQQSHFHYFMDVNGDGLTDWLSWQSSLFMVAVNRGDGTFTDWQPVAGADIETRQLPLGEFKGDITFLQYPRYSHSFRQFDYDADGRAEILVPGNYLAEACHTIIDDGDQEERCGTELYDPVDQQPDGAFSWASLNTEFFDDSVFQYKAMKFVEDASGNFSVQMLNTPLVGSAVETVVVDGFGNGLSDLVFAYGCRTTMTDCTIRNVTGAMSGKSAGLYINRNKGAATGSERYEPLDMLASIENGLGFRDEWHYRPLSSRDDRYHSSTKPFYERGGYLDNLPSSVQEDHFEFTSSMYVVAEHRQSNGVGGLNKKQYRYKGAVFNNNGRGFQGFHTIIEEDLAADIESQSDFHQIFPLSGKLHKQRQWALGDRTADSSSVNAFKESSFEWQFWPKGGHSSPVEVDALTDSWSVSANDPYFVGPKEQSSTYRTLEKSGNSRTHLYTQNQTTSFDAWGNVLSAENRYEEANSSHIVVSTTDTQYTAADETNWWINKPSKQTVTKKSIQSRNGVSIAANTDEQQSVVVDFLQWDSNVRKPKQVKTTPSNGKWTQVDTVYNSHGLLTKVTTSAEGEAQTRVVETTAFSADGYFPKTVKNALGHTVTTETNAKFGQPDSVTDANGLTTGYSYDAFGRAIKVTAPSVLGLKAAPDLFTALQWCNSGCSRASDALFKTVQQQAGMPERITYYDQLGRVIRTEIQAFDGSDWIARTVTYNALGQTTFESVPHYASSGTSYGTRYPDYDTFGRALRKTVNQTNGQQLDVTYTHEQASGFTTSIQVNGRLMSRTYNGLQQLTETIDALSGTTRYAYDGAGNPIVLQDASGNRITAKYNALGQKEWVDDPNMGSKSFTYTGFGEVETEIDGNLDITSFTYDRLGRMDSRSVNGTEEASWTYDSAANGKGLPAQESRSDANYARSYSYDALSRPYKVTTAIDGEDFVTVNHFDSNYGRLKGLSYPSGLTLQYGYNNAGYQFRTSNAASGYTYREITQMDAWGEWEFANVAAGNYTIGRSFHAETGQMAGTTFDNLVQNHQGIAYRYDSFGNLSEQVVQLPSKTPALNVENHYYDALNRLDYSTRTDGPSIDYDYDAIGNLLKKDDFASSYSYTGGSNGGPSAVKSVSLINGGTKTYGYDQNGNRTHENGAQQIWYNAFNKPTRINRNGANLYFYYGADQMRYKQVNQTSGKTTLYIGKLFEKITGGGETQYRHFIGDIAVLTTTEKGSEIIHKIGFSHRDRLGSAVAVGDETGNLKESHSFDPFGKPRQGNILDKDAAILESVYSTRGFTDHEHLDDVALIHMNGRAYDYNLGRFLSVDPVIQSPGNSQSLNPYSYIMNNPLAGTDPSGYEMADEVDEEESIEAQAVEVEYQQTGSRLTRTAKVTQTSNGYTVQMGSTALGGASSAAAASVTSDLMGLASRGNTGVSSTGGVSGQSGDAGNTTTNQSRPEGGAVTSSDDGAQKGFIKPSPPYRVATFPGKGGTVSYVDPNSLTVSVSEWKSLDIVENFIWGSFKGLAVMRGGQLLGLSKALSGGAGGTAATSGATENLFLQVQTTTYTANVSNWHGQVYFGLLGGVKAIDFQGLSNTTPMVLEITRQYRVMSGSQVLYTSSPDTISATRVSNYIPNSAGFPAYDTYR
ncbi:RHS repeat-associated core domain-containing protein [Microbulbifer sp. CNSA002]|uniref:RHS repeat-associated core domain-containing protein n=1 Tax=Microbulbifer sp. CNSA002 TaxID=3373604 RepID=UPI0039B666BB